MDRPDDFSSSCKCLLTPSASHAMWMEFISEPMARIYLFLPLHLLPLTPYNISSFNILCNPTAHGSLMTSQQRSYSPARV
ncbi:hypothetical protein E2C01_058732 [Portunus trituberculatus]|uniref:Uncharacterized protein n=1 Tax=Portunus trituberculatus TaxID=210409 RepID=A0A5B7H6Z8_PORTR|nr:hypothetical protein [Portunus trituberculatus]